MSKPLVAVVGRPNVGKSTLFNRLAGKRIAIVEDTPGVTRDRIYADCEWLGREFTLIDTGGIEPASEDKLLKQMRSQAELAIATADVIIFLCDGRAGLTAADHEVAHMLRAAKKPVLLAVNKLDTMALEAESYDFYQLGIADVFAISSANALGLGELLDAVISYFPELPEGDGQEHTVLNIAVVGRPNVGKSSIVNALLGEQRTIVSDISGTTRDSIDTPFEHDGRQYNLIDTAGIRKKHAIEDASIERYSVIRSLEAVRRCDVCLIVVDAAEGISEQDVKIAGYCDEEGKASIVLVNKWDAIEKETNTMNGFRKDIERELNFMSYVPQLYISALTGQRINTILSTVDEVFAQTSMRVSTGMLNEILNEAVTVTEPPSDHGRRLKVYYATQVSIRPPTFVFFVNEPKLMHFSYKRYLENYFRKSFGLKGTPIRLIIRKKEREEK